MIQNTDDLRKILFKSADSEYKKFSSALIPGETKMIGVRIPELRKIARTIANGDWKSFLAENRVFYFEEKMLQGFVIRYAQCDIDEKLEYVRNFIPLIDNWSICDSFQWKLKSSERDAMWDFIQQYFLSDKEFEVRFAAVTGRESFIDNEHIDALLKDLAGCRQPDYYAVMGIAWAIADCFIAFPEKTFHLLSGNMINIQTRDKALRKINESLRVPDEDKIRLKEFFLKQARDC